MLKAIVAVDENWAIGNKNQLLFHLHEDMKRFKELTTNHMIIMGRKTLESFPGGKPLPNRKNVVITHDLHYQNPDVIVVHSIEEAVQCAAKENLAWVVGGGSIYKAILPYCNGVSVTKIHSKAPEADTYFPNLDLDSSWSCPYSSSVKREGEIDYSFAEYARFSIF